MDITRTGRLALAMAAAIAAPRTGSAAVKYYSTVYQYSSSVAVDIRIGVPDDAKVLRGLVVNAADLEEATRVFLPWGFANLGIMIRNVDQVTNRVPIVMGAYAFACKALADSSGHKELPNLPLISVGFSKGGGWAAEFANRMPSKTICYGDGGSGAPSADWSDSSLKVPGAMAFSDADGFNWYPGAMDNLSKARPKGARWMLGVMWGLPHQFGYAGTLFYPFFERMIRARLPSDADPLKGPVKLKDLDDQEAWVGVTDSWGGPWPTIAKAADYKGDLSHTVWMPDAYMARVWQCFASKQWAVAPNTSPANGFKAGFMTQDAKVTVTLSDTTKGLKNCDYYDGDHLMASATTPPYQPAPFQFPDAGIHTLLPVVTLADGSQAVGRPVMFWVGAAAGASGLARPRGLPAGAAFARRGQAFAWTLSAPLPGAAELRLLDARGRLLRRVAGLRARDGGRSLAWEGAVTGAAAVELRSGGRMVGRWALE